MVSTYEYLYARTSCKASVPENGKVGRNDVELRIFPTQINYILIITYGKIFGHLKSSHLPEETTLI
jgi:hypothetical protein